MTEFQTATEEQDAVVLTGPRVIAVERRPIPVPAVGELLVEVRSVGICASDVNYYRNFQSRVRDIKHEPIVLGHEVSGLVVSAGSGTKMSLGTRVALEPGIACGCCRECRTGSYNLCRRLTFYGSRPTDGAMTGRVVLPERLVHPVEDSVGYDEAALAEPLAVAIRACRRADVSAGSRILVTGVGAIGLLVVQVAQAMGATQIAVNDIVQNRVDRALRTGATETYATSEVERQPDHEFDALVECTGVPAVVAAASEAVRPAGRIVLVGIGHARSYSLPVASLQAREIWTTGSYRYTEDFVRAVSLLNAGVIDMAPLITHRFSMLSAANALATASDDPSAIKVIIRAEAPLI